MSYQSHRPARADANIDTPVMRQASLKLGEPSLRILALLTDAYGARGGISRFNRDLLTALCASPRVSSVVALPRLAAGPLEPLPYKLDYRLGALGGKRRYLQALTRTLLTERFDAVVCGHINLLPLATAAATLMHAPTLLIVHGIDAWQPTSRWLTNRLAGRVGRCAAVSNFTLQKFLDWSHLPNSRASILPNCVSHTEFSPGPRPDYLVERYKLHGKRVLLTLSRLPGIDRKKGVDEMLESMQALLLRAPDLIYVIAGDGPDRPRLEAKCRALALTEHVRFTGVVSEHEKLDHYRLADVFTMPSRGEGFGIVFLEALACGLPVVAGNSDGSAEAVEGSGLCILVNPLSASELQDGILRALDLPRGTVPESLFNFSRERFAERVDQLLTSVAVGPHHPQRR